MARARDYDGADLAPLGRFEWERMLPDLLAASPAHARRLRAVAAMGRAVATFADPDGSSVHPGITQLSAVVGMTEKAVRDRLDDLRALGILTRTSAGCRWRREADVYRLTWPTDFTGRVTVFVARIDDERAAFNARRHARNARCADQVTEVDRRYTDAVEGEVTEVSNGYSDCPEGEVTEVDRRDSLGSNGSPADEVTEVQRQSNGSRLPPTNHLLTTNHEDQPVEGISGQNDAMVNAREGIEMAPPSDDLEPIEPTEGGAAQLAPLAAADVADVVARVLDQSAALPSYAADRCEYCDQPDSAQDHEKQIEDPPGSGRWAPCHCVPERRQRFYRRRELDAARAERVPA